MKGFIEITEQTEELKMIVNVNHIFRVFPLKNDMDIKCRIELTPIGFGNYPYQVVDVLESYKQVKNLISEAT